MKQRSYWVTQTDQANTEQAHTIEQENNGEGLTEQDFHRYGICDVKTGIFDHEAAQHCYSLQQS